MSETTNFQNRAFFSLLHLAQVIGSHAFGRETHIAVVSNHMHDVTGGELVIADKSSVLGPIKVIPQEYPDVRCCAVDIGASQLDDATLIDTILSEAVTNVLEPVVAYRGGHRWVQSFERVRLEKELESHSWLKQAGTYLITGGTGGLGLVFAEFLARVCKPNLVLTARKALPQEEEWDSWLSEHDINDTTSGKILAVRSMRALGATVEVSPADVTDSDAMGLLVTDVQRRFGMIDGVIHAAGIPGDGIIQLKKDELARDILAPKIQGTMVLDRILAEHPPSWILLCSSVASFLGGIGLVDYCSANAYLDTFVAVANKRGTTRWISINWDMWGETGMGLKTAMPDELRQWLDKELRDGLTSTEGIGALDRVMTWNKSSNVIVSTRDLQARIDLWVRREFIKTKESLLDEEESTQARYNRPALGPTYEAPRNEIEETIAAAWRKLFSVEPIGRTDNYFELGGHSLLATTLVSRLKKEFNTSLSIRDILDHPVLADLAEYIALRKEGTIGTAEPPHAIMDTENA